MYTGSLLNYNRTHNGAFVIASGAILGLGAAFLWITQGAIMLSYPLPHQKGRSACLSPRLTVIRSEHQEHHSRSSIRYRSFLGHLQPRRRHRQLHLPWHQLQPHSGRHCLRRDIRRLHDDHAGRMGGMPLPRPVAPCPAVRWLASGSPALAAAGRQSLVGQVQEGGSHRGEAHYPAQGRVAYLGECELQGIVQQLLIPIQFLVPMCA
jgi:hypothetical protein